MVNWLLKITPLHKRLYKQSENTSHKWPKLFVINKTDKYPEYKKILQKIRKGKINIEK